LLRLRPLENGYPCSGLSVFDDQLWPVHGDNLSSPVQMGIRELAEKCSGHLQSENVSQRRRDELAKPLKTSTTRMRCPRHGRKQGGKAIAPPPCLSVLVTNRNCEARRVVRGVGVHRRASHRGCIEHLPSASLDELTNKEALARAHRHVAKIASQN